MALAVLVNVLPLLCGIQGDESLAYHAWFDVPGGELPFGLVLSRADEGWSAELVNGPGRVPVEHCRRDGDELRLELPSYDSRILARTADDGRTFDGTWSKVRGKEKVARVPFHARRGAEPRFPFRRRPGLPKNVAGRWTVDFSSDELPAVAVFEQELGKPSVTGTFLTSTGDYRYLAGSVDGNELRLSCFDGGHAFLFRAELSADGGLSGDFWSGDWWHETWTARRDDGAALEDPFAQTAWSGGIGLGDLLFPDLDGHLRSLAEPELAGRVTILQVFGSWCPNCHDETAFLVELDERYRARGLSIVGLACELTGDFERDAGQVRIFAERCGVDYPLLVAGTADKARATLAVGALDRVRSFPTTIFLDGRGRVREVHSGFSGPATGAEHERLRARFEALIEELLAEEPPPGEAWTEVEGERLWFDRAAGVLRDPFDFGRRVAIGGSATPLLARRGIEDEADVLAALADPDALVRREAVVALVALRGAAPVPEVVPLLDDESLAVRIAATWAVGETGEPGGRERLYEGLEHPSPALRLATVQALVRMSSEDPGVLLLLAGVRDDPVQEIRELVSAALGEDPGRGLEYLRDLGYGGGEER